MSSISSLLRESIQFYRAHASVLAGYLAWLLLPFSGFVLLRFVPNADAVFFGSVILTFVEAFLWIWLTILLILIIDTLQQGKKIDPPSLQETTRRLIWPLIVVAVLEIITVLGGFLLFIIPGLIFAVWFAFAQLSVVLDKKRGIEAMNFSRSLVKGRFFQAALYIFGGPSIVFLLYATLLALIIILASEFGSVSIEMFFIDQVPLWFIVLDTLAQLFVITPILLIYSILVYKIFRATLHSPGRDETSEV